MKYIDAGYIIGLGVIAAYAAVLLERRRRLERRHAARRRGADA